VFQVAGPLVDDMEETGGRKPEGVLALSSRRSHPSETLHLRASDRPFHLQPNCHDEKSLWPIHQWPQRVERSPSEATRQRLMQQTPV
jgi:hypothetical protein